MATRFLLHDREQERWLRFDEPCRVIIATRLDEVVDALHETECEVDGKGLTAVGFIAYEAGPAFDPAVAARAPAPGVPLLAFALFDGPPTISSRRPWPDPGPHRVGDWSASVDDGAYLDAVARIRRHIARGDTYQVNHTFRLRAPFEGDPMGLFDVLVRAQPRSYAAYLDFGGLVVCSASPELLVDLDGSNVRSRPMKGTAPRGWDPVSDRERERQLAASAKDRAENAMIVDMVRSDIGRIAEVGSVEVTDRFRIERHPSVFQMTSTVEARSRAPVAEVIAALFPFASVTGAPKVRTSELIRELEEGPRGVYTGAVGWIRPGRRARFAVAIRTAMVDRNRGEVVYGVGSGIVWDSVAGAELEECRTKAAILSGSAPDFELLETVLWTPDGGFALLDEHLNRMAGAAEYFDRPFHRDRVTAALADVAGTAPLRVRVLVAGDASVRVETTPLDRASAQPPVRLGLAAEPVEPHDPFLHFKTTHREVYRRAAASRPDCDDVLLWNTRGEVTESTIANLVAMIDDELVTPPLSCGLLAGVFRAGLVERGEVRERVIRVDELERATALYLVNSVRGRYDVVWVGR